MKKITSLIHKTIAMIFIMAVCVSTSYAGNLFSVVDNNVVTPNQTVTLLIEYDQKVKSSKLKLDELKKDFDVLSVVPQSSSSTSIVNGSVTRETKTTWRLTLAPKRLGTLTIPSFSIDGDLSQKITIESKDSATPNADQALEILISADSDSVYVSEQLIVTVEVYAQQGLSRLSLNPIETDAEIKELSQDREQRIENGIIRDIFTNRYIMFPTEPGTLTLPSTTVSAIKGGQHSIFGSSGGKQVIARSVPLDIKVKPTDNTHSPWFPATEVIIDSKWSGDTNSIIAGEPITRSLTISALGKEASAIPPLKLPVSTDFKSYKDQPVTNDKRTYKGIIGQRIESEAIVFSTPGTYTLPAVTMKWWNIKSGAWQEAVAPSETVTVLTGSGSTKESNEVITPPQAPINADNSNVVEVSSKTHWLWPLISGLLFIICLIQTFFLWKLKSTDTNPKHAFSNQPKNTSEKSAWMGFQQAIKTNDLVKVRQSLHDWTQTLSNDGKQKSIHDLANYLDDSKSKSKLSSLITGLESCLYKEKSSFDNANLFEQLKALRKHIQSTSTASTKQDTLAPLYKN